MKLLKIVLAIIALFLSLQCLSSEKYEGHIVVAYVTSGGASIPDPFCMTHINYAFGHVNETFDGIDIANEERLLKIAALKKINPELNILLSVGGWGSGRFSEMASDPKTRMAFAKDCMRVIKEFGIDGIDIDWEYPTSDAAGISSSPDDTRNYTLLMRDIRKYIGKGRILTLASVANASYIDFKSILPYIDFVNIMSYDMGMPPLHHSALYPSRHSGWCTASDAVEAHVKAGVLESRLVMGMPFYGRGGNGYPDFRSFAAIEQDTCSTKVWDDEGCVPYIADKDGALVCGYDDVRSIEIKCGYIIEKGLLGGMYWQYDADDPEGTLRNKVKDMLLGERPSFFGKVFADRNGNGVFDKGDMPLAGVAVSDGLNVVKTGGDGVFRLPGHDKARFVFVSVPSGYKTDNAYYKRIEGGLHKYDFALLPYDSGAGRDGSHAFVQLTDSEIFNTSGNEVWVDEVRQCAENCDAAFIVHTGDLCYEKGLKTHIGLMNTENMGRPVYYCIGNHDLVKGAYGEELYESIYGPVWYSFDVSGTHYVVLPMLRGDYRPSYTIDDASAWLKNDLDAIQPGTPVVILSHYMEDHARTMKYGSVDLQNYNVKAWLYGHLHTNFIYNRKGIPSYCSSVVDKGGVDHSAAGFRVFRMSGDGRLSSELRFPYIDNKVTIASPRGRSCTDRLTVNAYSTVSKVKSVLYSVVADGMSSKWKKAESMTSWSWGAEMGLDGAKAGKELAVVVKAEFEDGGIVRDTVSFCHVPSEAGSALPENWTNLLGNAAHNGKGKDLNAENVRLAWVANAGGEIFMTSPVVYDGNVYTATTDENAKGNSHICAMDGKDGRLLWKYRTEGSVKNTIAAGCGLIFAQDIYGCLYAVNAVDGTLSWKAHLNVNAGVPELISGLAVDNGTLYAGNGLGLAAFEAATGRKLWENKEWKQREGSTNTLAVGDGVVVGGVQWMALYGNDAETGKMLWSHSENGLRDRGASAAVHGHLLYIVSGKSLFIMDAESGEIIVRRQLPYNLTATSTPAVTDESIVFGTADAGVVALDRETLSEKWNFRTGNAILCTVPYSRPSGRAVETSPVPVGDKVCVCASDGSVYLLDSRDGKEVWKYTAGAPFLGSAAVSGDVLLVSDYGGNIYAFSFGSL